MAAITMAPEMPMSVFRRRPSLGCSSSPAGRDATAGAGSPRAVVAAGSTGLRLTRRGRAVVIGAAVMVAVGLGSVAQHAAADGPPRSVPVDTWTVASGESLWQIAGAVAAPGQDLRVVVAELIELNGLSGAGLQVGQQILVPRG